MEGSETMILAWSDYEKSVTGALVKLRADQDFFDVTLVVDDGQLKAHKVIISACSPLFKSILQTNPHQHPLLYLRGIRYQELSAVLDFIYSGEVQVPRDNLMDFMAVAKDLQIKGLSDELEEKQSPVAAKPTKKRKNESTNHSQSSRSKSVVKVGGSSKKARHNNNGNGSSTDGGRTDTTAAKHPSAAHNQKLAIECLQQENEDDDENDEISISAAGTIEIKGEVPEEEEVLNPLLMKDEDDHMEELYNWTEDDIVEPETPYDEETDRMASDPASQTQQQYFADNEDYGGDMDGSDQPDESNAGDYINSPAYSEFLAELDKEINRKINNVNGVWTCLVCQYNSKKVSHVKEHVEVKHTVARNDFYCEICHKRFKNRVVLRRHKTVHRQPTGGSAAVKPITAASSQAGWMPGSHFLNMVDDASSSSANHAK